MAKNSVDLLELLRQGGMEGDVDFRRETRQVLVEVTIACPAPRHAGCRGFGADWRSIKDGEKMYRAGGPIAGFGCRRSGKMSG